MANGSEHLDSKALLATLWHKAQPMIAAFVAGSVSNHHDVEDLVQQVAVAIAQDFDKYDPNTPFLRWALVIARNRVLNYRRGKATDRHAFDSETLDQIARAAERHASRHEANMEDMIAALGECMQSIEGKSAQVLEMRYLREMKPAQIAKRMVMSSNAVFVMLHRVRAALEICIKRRLRQAEAHT